MNLTNYTDQDGFEIEIFEDYNGEKWLKKGKRSIMSTMTGE